MTEANPTTSCSTVAQITQRIKSRIRLGMYLPGQRLIGADLREEFAVSNGVVREALRQLAGEGLIELPDNRSAQIRTLAPSDIVEIYQLREQLEGLAAALTAGRIKKDAALKKQLRELLNRAEQDSRSSDIARYTATNFDLHSLIVGLCGNSRIGPVVDQLSLPLQRLHLYRFMDQRAVAQSAREHRLIVQAILAADTDAAGTRMREHIRSSLGTVLSQASAAMEQGGRLK